MSGSKMASLAKDTAIYGVSSIVGRFLNYLLVPLHTNYINPASGGYGIVTEMYAWAALLFVLLTFGMETTFFRFASKQEENEQMVYSTALRLVGGVSLLFMVLAFCFITSISAKLGYAEHPEYVGINQNIDLHYYKLGIYLNYDFAYHMLNIHHYILLLFFHSHHYNNNHLEPM